jgi:hypothetical protein
MSTKRAKGRAGLERKVTFAPHGGNSTSQPPDRQRSLNPRRVILDPLDASVG